MVFVRPGFNTGVCWYWRNRKTTKKITKTDSILRREISGRKSNVRCNFIFSELIDQHASINRRRSSIILVIIKKKPWGEIAERTAQLRKKKDSKRKKEEEEKHKNWKSCLGDDGTWTHTKTLFERAASTNSATSTIKTEEIWQVPTGFEPATLGLTDPRSTTELRNKNREKRDLNPHHVGRQPSTLPLSYSPKWAMAELNHHSLGVSELLYH